MREIEAKVLEINRKEIEKKLKNVGAKKHGTIKMKAAYFDFPAGSLKKQGKVVRLRLEGKDAVFCLKCRKAKSKLKNMEELETKVENFNETKKMLLGLGLLQEREFSKTRTSYKLGKASIELDKMPGIPLFLEIEAPSEKLVIQTAKKLGFTQQQLLPWNVFDVLRHYKKY